MLRGCGASRAKARTRGTLRYQDRRRALTPLVGRAEEIRLLRRRWDYAKEGDGQLVLLSAPAGFRQVALDASRSVSISTIPQSHVCSILDPPFM